MRLAISLLAAALFSAHAHAAAPNMKEGLWEITTRMEMPGMPSGMPPQVMQRCITRKDLEDPSKMMAGRESPDSRCQVTDHKVQGNTATWNFACKGGDAMTGNGTATYSGTSYTGTNKMTTKHGGQPQAMTMHYSGRHLGACNKP